MGFKFIFCLREIRKKISAVGKFKFFFQLKDKFTFFLFFLRPMQTQEARNNVFSNFFSACWKFGKNIFRCRQIIIFSSFFLISRAYAHPGSQKYFFSNYFSACWKFGKNIFRCRQSIFFWLKN